MSKFKVGDKVIPVKIDGVIHKWLREGTLYLIKNIPEGDLVDIVELSSDQTTLADGRGDSWSEDWFELYEENGKEMTAERIREDILHIEKRIEEAKKDITSMEQEKNVLIEKLKKKGFILLSDNQSAQAYVRPSVGDLVRVIRVDEDYDEGIYLGYEFVIKRDDGSGLPYMDDCYNWFREDSVVKI